MERNFEESGGRSLLGRASRMAGLAFAAALLLPLSGCATVGMIASKSEEFELADSVTLRARPRDFVAAVEAAGKSLKYDVAGLDRANNKITLSDNSSLATGILIGKTKQFRMEVSLGSDGRTANIMAYAMGNFGSGDREKVEKRIADFKAALIAQTT
ncbi:MAG: hypothetical protein KA312_01645 [Sphingorhabdus sp.]|nr:hypothetical protein [Sphingorhabdus sp.]